MFERALAGIASLAGLAGVALSAAAAHSPGGPLLDTAARFLLIHAAALLAVAALVGGGSVAPRLGSLAGLVVLFGLALFCGDLLRRAYSGVALFPMAAPAGGFLLMTGWVLIALAALLGSRS